MLFNRWRYCLNSKIFRKLDWATSVVNRLYFFGIFDCFINKTSLNSIPCNFTKFIRPFVGLLTDLLVQQKWKNVLVNFLHVKKMLEVLVEMANLCWRRDVQEFPQNKKSSLRQCSTRIFFQVMHVVFICCKVCALK